MKCCQRCGKPVPRRKGGAKWCSAVCRRAASRERKRPAWQRDVQERQCIVCGQAFVSRRYSQTTCGKPCLWHLLNARRIAKHRKTTAEPRVSPELAARRALAVQQRWTPAKKLSRMRGRRGATYFAVIQRRGM